MAWTDPTAVWSLDQLVDHDDLNIYLRDNLAELRAGLYTTVYRTADQSIPDNTSTSISWQAESPKDTAIWAVGNPTRLTVPTGYGGRWLLSVLGEWAWDIDGERRAGYRINGGATNYQVADMAASDIANISYFLIVLSLSAGDYVEIRLEHTANNALNCIGGSLQHSRAVFRWLGPTGTEGEGLAWREPQDWDDGQAVLHWHLQTDLADTPRVLWARQEASVKAYLRAGQDLECGADADLRLSFDTAEWNYGGLMETPPEEANQADTWRTSNFTIRQNGLYLIWAQVPWDTFEGGASHDRRDVRLILNDSDAGVVMERTQTTVSATAGDGWFRQCASWVYLLKAGDEVQLEIFNKGGQSQPLDTGQYRGVLLGFELLTALPEDGVSVPAWTAPRTWSAGEVPTAALLREQVHDNLLNLRYGRGQACLLIKDGNQGIGRLVEDPITWSRALVNVGGMWSSGSGITIQVAGRYGIYCYARWEAFDNIEFRGIDLTVNTTTLRYARGVMSLTTDSWGPHFSFYTELDLVQGDVLRFAGYQDSDTTLDVRHPTQCAVILMNDS